MSGRVFRWPGGNRVKDTVTSCTVSRVIDALFY